MEIEVKEKTALATSVGADERQSIQSKDRDIISDYEADFNMDELSFEEMQRNLRALSDPSYLRTITMKELYETVYEGKPPLIDGLLYTGTYLFVGSPKVGKSFLMAQLAYHISTGTPLWGYSTRKSTVLYLALEDDYHRLQERLYRMVGSEGTENLFFSITASQLGAGLDEQLNRFVQEHPDTRLIIIDTLQKVRELGGDTYSYANDYQIITRLKQFADAHKICLLLVHHTRKQGADDKFDMISGTNGLLGAADGAFLLSKVKRTENNATLDVSGRDQPDQRLYLTKNPTTLVWELDRVETELYKAPEEPILEQVARTVNAESPVWVGSPTELAELLGTDMKPNVLTLKLNVNASRLLDDYGIRYENKRTHDGRKVRLTFLAKKEEPNENGTDPL